ncbi:lytic transglycosylase domain-containing protein [Sphingosinicella terrae]|uniref:lytic transglycosylase domain-containing protein n=1 Tax=Sphingosinicella terrae TaxID=2172047 RepID=UPI00254785AF|nr:lytic transglycosylase domain-containing protein [Sphingosinicella terrae]
MSNPEPAVRQASLLPVAAAVAAQAAPGPSSAIASSIERWRSLRGNDNLPFSSYASFLVAHRGWPGESALRRVAERQSAEPGVSSAEAIRFFQAFPPLTATGHAGHAFALLSGGRPDEARNAARAAWTAGVLPVAVEQRMLGAFGGALTPQDHDRRMDALLDNGDTQSAQRTLAWVSPARRPLYEARLALQARAPDAASRVAALGSAGAGDPGLLIDRAKWMRETGNSMGARELLAQPRRLTTAPANPEKYMEALVTIARGAANDRQWTLAYQIASQVDGIYPTGTDVSQKSFGERDEYTNLTWLAGTSALLKLNRPADAIGMFERYARAAQSPQTQTKGLYWAARAANRAGQTGQSRTLLEEAAGHYDQYYGQLAAERLGRPLPAPTPPVAVTPSPAERQAFYNQPIVAAVRYLGQIGQWRDQTDFVRALAQHVDTDNERLMAVQLGEQIGRVDLGVLVARQARTDGSFEYKRWGFPEVRVPAAQQRHWTIVHAITRQESLFDRQAISRAGARGLMQLMPGTAREVAGRLGIGYAPDRLTGDPEYNVLLGSTYFNQLLNQWGGNYPLAVASYNAGAGNVRRWIRENGDPRTGSIAMIDWIEEIPFFETRNYVQRVLENAVVYDLMNPNRAGSPPQNRLSYYLGEQQPG